MHASRIGFLFKCRRAFGLLPFTEIIELQNSDVVLDFTPHRVESRITKREYAMSCFNRLVRNRTGRQSGSRLILLGCTVLAVTGCSTPSHRQQLDQDVVVLEGKIAQLNHEIEQLKAQQLQAEQKKIASQQSVQQNIQ